MFNRKEIKRLKSLVAALKEEHRLKVISYEQAKGMQHPDYYQPRGMCRLGNDYRAAKALRKSLEDTSDDT